MKGVVVSFIDDGMVQNGRREATWLVPRKRQRMEYKVNACLLLKTPCAVKMIQSEMKQLEYRFFFFVFSFNKTN